MPPQSIVASRTSRLTEKIGEEIRAHGPITFARFMELALYCPGLGYYTSPRTRIGKEGDFYTSPHVHPLFGTLIAVQLREMWARLGEPAPFTVVEFGAGTGLMAGDVLRTVGERWPRFHRALRYVIIEASPAPAGALAGEEAARFQRLDQVIAQRGPLTGCVLSNEVVDALPVHRVRREGEHLREIFVTLEDGGFAEVSGAPSTPALADYLAWLGVALADGQEAEVNLAALRWVEEVAGALERGFVLTVDYGYEARELYDSQRFPRGTLMAYHRHRATTDLYRAIGQQDLTAHVNFTALMRRGREVGLATTGFTNQMKFLIALGILEEAEQQAQSEPQRAIHHRLAAKRLIVPQGMGETFKVLIQHKGVDDPQLRGLRPL